MNRPYYVHTPRNVHGENLVHAYNDVCYVIRATHTGKRNYAQIKDRVKADAEAKRLNDEHEVQMAFAMHI